MELVRFSEKLAGKDPTAAPYRIPARDLDRNFSMLKPLKADGNARQYLLTETPEGWAIKIFPDFPSGAGPFFLAFSGGGLYWAGSGTAQDNELGSLNLVPTPPSSGTYVLGSVNGIISWLATEACI